MSEANIEKNEIKTITEPMRAVKAVEAIMDWQGVNYSALAERMGLNSTQTLWERLVGGRKDKRETKSISVKNLNQILNALDYRVVAVPKGKRLPDGSVVME